MSIKKIVYFYDNYIIPQDIIMNKLHITNIPIVGQIIIYNNEQYVIQERIFDGRDQVLNIKLKKLT